MSSTYGNNLKLSIFGQSHGPAVGMTLDGIPAGLPVDLLILQEFLNRRAPGKSSFSTPRREEDAPEFLAGILNGHTCGAPIAAIIRNHNTHSGDYDNLRDCPRPGHADLTAQIKYGGWQDASGGGHFSGRLTAPLCIAGGLCIQWLNALGIRVGAHLYAAAGIPDVPFDPMKPELDRVGKCFPVLDEHAGEQMQTAILKAKEEGDSVGGIVECAVTGLPAGLGDPMFDRVENRISQAVFGIPAVKGLEFGAGFAAAASRGSINNDPFGIRDGKVTAWSNASGGVLGGITNGMPLIFRVGFKPTPSIAIPQQSISLSRQQAETLTVKGRHDPCIAPRAVPVVEAAAALALYDMILGTPGSQGGK